MANSRSHTATIRIICVVCVLRVAGSRTATTSSMTHATMPSVENTTYCGAVAVKLAFSSAMGFVPLLSRYWYGSLASSLPPGEVEAVAAAGSGNQPGGASAAAARSSRATAICCSAMAAVGVAGSAAARAS